MTQRSTQPPTFPQEIHPGAVLAVLMVGTFLAPLDSSIVNITLPAISAEFHESVAAVSWVATAYLLANAALLLTMGRLGDLWGLRRVYVTGMLIFGTGSLLSAAAPSLALLVSARVVQAVGASMLFAAGPALITRAFPAEKRGTALGMISLSVSAGLTAGPALGGVLLQTFGWPSVFLINVPLAVVAAIMAWRLLPTDTLRAERFDLPGAALAAATLVALFAGLAQAEEGALSIGLILGQLLAVGLGIAFVKWERQATHPMLDLTLFRSRALAGGVIAALLSYLALFSVTFTLPFYLLRIESLDPRAAGLLLTATPLSMALFSPLAGRLSDRWGSRWLATGGLLVLALGLVGMSFLTPSTQVFWVPVLLLVLGGGMAIFQTPNTASILRAAPGKRAGVASALVAEARNVGMATGIALTAAVVALALGGTPLPSGDGGIPAEMAIKFMTGMKIAMRVSAALAVAGALACWIGGRGEVEAGSPNP